MAPKLNTKYDSKKELGIAQPTSYTIYHILFSLLFTVMH
jgi:hypothetical protein